MEKYIPTKEIGFLQAFAVRLLKSIPTISIDYMPDRLRQWIECYVEDKDDCIFKEDTIQIRLIRKEERQNYCRCGVPLHLHNTCCGWANASLIVYPHDELEIEWQKKYLEATNSQITINGNGCSITKLQTMASYHPYDALDNRMGGVKYPDKDGLYH